MTLVCEIKESSASEMKDARNNNPRPKFTNKQKIKMLTEAFERLYQNYPLHLPRGTFIDRATVELEAQLPKNTIHDRNEYQLKLISKINFAQELILNGKTPQQIEEHRKKASRQQAILRKLYLALNRLIDEEPIYAKKGAKINLLNVSIEAGYASSYFRSKDAFLAEIIADIEKAHREQCLKREFEKRQAKLNVNIFQSKEVALKRALQRMTSNNNLVTKQGSEITVTSVCIEAGIEPNFLKANNATYSKVIAAVEAAEVQRLKNIFIQALGRLKSGETKRVHPNIKISLESVSIEAGFARTYLECYKWIFADIISEINKQKQQLASA